MSLHPRGVREGREVDWKRMSDEAREVPSSERGTESIDSARRDARRLMRERVRAVVFTVVEVREGVDGSANFTDARAAVAVFLVVVLTKIDVVDCSLPDRRAGAVRGSEFSRPVRASVDLCEDRDRGSTCACADR
jgi:hypothetical protein